MEKITGYESCKKEEVKCELDCLQLTLLITPENEKHIKKCLNDSAFISSLVKIATKDEPRKVQIRLGVEKIVEK